MLDRGVSSSFTCRDTNAVDKLAAKIGYGSRKELKREQQRRRRQYDPALLCPALTLRPY